MYFVHGRIGDFMQRSNEERDTISDYAKVRQFRTEMKRLMEEAAEELKGRADIS